MAHASSKVAKVDIDRKPINILRLIRLTVVGAAAFAAFKVQWKKFLIDFFTGPGKISRILMLFFALVNLKNMPFVWTYRLWHGILYHCFYRKAPRLGPRSLFRPVISESHSPLMEIDYNVHKSNSTYFSDLDIARTHLATHICRTGFRKLTHNKETKIILDPDTGKPRGGHFGVMLGGVACTFHREITAYAPYEMWTRVLSWDRKWFYMVTHFVPRGLVKPTEYLDPLCTKYYTRDDADVSEKWKSKVYATAVSKYCFKLGRLTIHPAVALELSELLPQRPGGWQDGPNSVGDEDVDLSGVTNDGSWDWKMVEKRRRDGMEYAQQFGNLENLKTWFDGEDGGDGSAIGRFGLPAASWL